MATAEMFVVAPRFGQTGALTQRSGNGGHQVVQDGLPRYAQAVLDGNVYIGANTAGVATQGSMSATTPPLTLYNPIGSSVALVLLNFTAGVTVAPGGAATIALALNTLGAAAPSSVTLATIVNANGTTPGAPRGQCYRIATLAAAPLAVRWSATFDATGGISAHSIADDIAGGLVLLPGACLSVQSLTTALTLVASFTWQEVAFPN